MTDHMSRHPGPIIIRTPVLDWLHGHADIAVRLVVAPPGFGKTTALAAYAGAPSDRRRLNLVIDARLTSAEFSASIAEAASPSSPTRPVEIVIDDAHLAGVDLLAALNAFSADLPDNVFLIIASQRRDVFDVGTLFARGLIAVCDQSELAFGSAEARALFAAQQIDAAPAAIDALVARSDGWPLAIAGTVREMSRALQSVDAAYDRWRQRWAVPALDLLSALLERVPFAERTTARRHFQQGGALDQHTLAVLHRCGFFVRFDAGTFATMRWVNELYPASQSMRGERSALDVELFGRFTASVAGVPIVWARRRDQHIIKYLLLRPNASATRAELADVFWPQTPRPLAMQSLRTACSTIRHAIGNVVGMQHVDHYLVAGERLVINRAAVVCDVDRFRLHAAAAEADDAAGLLGDAIMHLRAAERLYRHGLFAGDISEPVFLDDAQALAAIYARVLARLSGALIERGSPDLARDYAAKRLKLGVFRGGPTGAQVHLRFAAS